MERKTTLRPSTFFGLFVVLAMTEAFAPPRARAQKCRQRWDINWGAAVSTGQNNWSFFNPVSLPFMHK